MGTTGPSFKPLAKPPPYHDAPILWFRQQRCDLLSPSLNGLRPAHVPKHTRLHIRNRDQQPGHFQLQAWSGRYLVPSWVKMP